MDQRHKEILQKNFVYLVENLDLRHTILIAYLVQENLLSECEKQILEVSRDIFTLFWKLQ